MLRQLSKAIEDESSPEAYVMCDNRYDIAEELTQLYGGLLFLGCYIGILFLMATVLIIYYKQISEGYEDRRRFEIMMKVGMSREEVKRTIKSQILMVFFIPIAVDNGNIITWKQYGAFCMVYNIYSCSIFYHIRLGLCTDC